MSQPKIQRRIRWTSLSLLIVLILASISCESKTSQSESSKKSAEPKTIREEALELLANYPKAQFVADMSEKVASHIGQDAVDEVRTRIGQRYSDQELRDIHITFLTETFTKEELALLNSIYLDPLGRSLMNKFLIYHEKWMNFSEPIVMAVMSNVEENPIRSDK